MISAMKDTMDTMSGKIPNGPKTEVSFYSRADLILEQIELYIKQQGKSEISPTELASLYHMKPSLKSEIKSMGGIKAMCLVNNKRITYEERKDQATKMITSFLKLVGYGSNVAARGLFENEQPQPDSDHKFPQLTDEVLTAIATNLRATKKYKQFLKTIQGSTSGFSCDQICRDYKTIPIIIRSQYQLHGTQVATPKPILLKCPELAYDSKTKLFYPAATHGSAHDLDAGANDGEDCHSVHVESATIDFLLALKCIQMIHDRFDGRKWPTSLAETTKEIGDLFSADSILHEWLRRQKHVEASIASLTPLMDLDIAIATKLEHITEQVCAQFQRQHWLSIRKKECTWHFDRIQNAIISGDYILFAGEVQPQPGGTTEALNPQVDHKAPSLILRSGERVYLIDSEERLKLAVEGDEILCGLSDLKGEHIAVDCEGVPEDLFLLQIATKDAIYIVDCVQIEASRACALLAPMFSNDTIVKLFHDLRCDSVALTTIGGIPDMRGTLDTQLVTEHLTGKLMAGFNEMLQQFSLDPHPLKKSFKGKFENDRRLFARRPIAKDALEYAALDVSLLLHAADHIVSAIGDKSRLIQQASDKRALIAIDTGGNRKVCFDTENNYTLASAELLDFMRPNARQEVSAVEISDDAQILLDLLPADFTEVLVNESTTDLSDIVIDLGRRPIAWKDGERVLLGGEDRVVLRHDIDSVTNKLGGFGSDNRAGLEKQLHRVSALRNRAEEIIGLTMRVGRHIGGNADMIIDLLFGDEHSILILGEPGCGKTTVVRAITKLLAERNNVCIVDTSNEIAGDGDVPHPCVGFARRMMVPSLDRQSETMVQCVQNHTPDIMVIDEIGRTPEVEAARTCKQRGVRMVASAHGDLRKLVKNKQLRGLVGGLEQVTIGDGLAEKKAKQTGGEVRKVEAQRAGAPIFEVIIELRRREYHEWRIVLDAADAVDSILSGSRYKAQRRSREPTGGPLSLCLEQA